MSKKDLKVQNKLNGHRIRRRFSASFLLEGEGDFVHILKGQAYTCTKVPKGRGGKYETNLCNHNASYYLCKRYANSYICKDEQQCQCS